MSGKNVERRFPMDEQEFFDSIGDAAAQIESVTKVESLKRYDLRIDAIKESLKAEGSTLGPKLPELEDVLKACNVRHSDNSLDTYHINGVKQAYNFIAQKLKEKE